MPDPYVVFSQREGGTLDAAELKRHAAQFFATRLGLAEPEPDGAIGVVVATDEENGVRLARARPRDDADLARAAEAEARSRGAGLADLAKRCPTVWLVATEGDGDRVALRVAAILAGVLLGPILAPGASSIFGPKTARERLAR